MAHVFNDIHSTINTIVSVGGMVGGRVGWVGVVVVGIRWAGGAVGHRRHHYHHQRHRHHHHPTTTNGDMLGPLQYVQCDDTAMGWIYASLIHLTGQSSP